MTLIKKKTNYSNDNKVSTTKRVLNSLSRIGKALLIPIAVMPLAAIFLRLGVQIPETTAFSRFIHSIMSGAGSIVFDNLPILFAVGVAFGLTKDHRGEAALAGLVGILFVKYLMSSEGADLSEKIYGHAQLSGGLGFHHIFGNKYNAILSNNVLNGVIAGILVSYIYNHFHAVELPKVLGFFGGRRLITVLTISSIIFLGILWAIVFPWLGYVLYLLSDAMASATGNRYGNAAIMGVYGVLNRFLLPFGLHQVPNSIFWFQLGDFGPKGNINGDINGFLSAPAAWETFGTTTAVFNNAGTFQSGFFPIMMFGLPALVAAIWFTADDKEQRNRVIALMSGAALISFLTGITEPIEYAFLFAAPALFGIHALLTGVFGFITGLFGIQIGFGFSAGLIDYGLSLPKSMEIIHTKVDGFTGVSGIYHKGIWSKFQGVMANPWWIFVIGAAAAVTYFFVGVFAIKKWNIQTPGRGGNRIPDVVVDDSSSSSLLLGSLKPQNAAIVKAFGGWDNITEFGNCTTRLRYDVKDSSLVDEKALKNAGAIGVVKISKTHVQAIIGTQVESINQNIQSNKGADLGNIKTTKKINVIKTESLTKNIEVFSVGIGTIKTLASLNDGVFSKNMMGDGIVIAAPKTSKSTSLYAPVSGKLITVFPTGHAYGIKTPDGAEVLIHVGIDTVNLKGKGFKSVVKQGQEINVGDKLVNIDLDFVRKNAPTADAIILVTSGHLVTNKASGEVTKTSKLFTIEQK